jgi:NAD(P)-dependent dehydrogenase (short-subunit alcohol dehydrogenase family)
MARTVLVTGAGGGLGRAIVRAYSAAGDQVVGADVSQQNLDVLQANEPGARTIRADISTPAGCDELMSSVGSNIDVLVNNAGNFHGGQLDTIDDATFFDVLAVHLHGAFYMSRRVVDGMLARGDGRIVNIASVAGLGGGRAGTAYTVSKWGLVGLTKNIAAALGPDGIRCNTICPTVVEVTDGLETERSFVMSPNRPSTPTDADLRTGSQRDPYRPASTTADAVAALCVFLTSDAAKDINGAVIPLDNGWLAY